MIISFIYSEIRSHSLKQFLKNHGFSRRLLKKEIQVFVNGLQVNLNTFLHPNDHINVILPKESTSIYPWNFPLDILFEDEYFLILNKKSGIPSIPSIRYPYYTIANAVYHYYLQHHKNFGIHILTRLDKETSGIILIAKHQYIQSLMHHLSITKKYLAFTDKMLDDEQGILKFPILKQENEMRRIIHKNGEIGITEYLLKSTKYPIFCYECILHTGKTHQIRIHFSHINAPLLGDTLYGGSNNIIQRCALHCSEISFVHPITKKIILIRCELPDDLKLLLENKKAPQK